MGVAKGTMPPNFVSLVGQPPYGRLTVVSYLGRSKWGCDCSCGNYVEVSTGNLKTGNTTSCGCFRREHTRQAKTTHGQAKQGQQSREYRAWSNMKDRCYNSNIRNYHRYGGRGIRVCKRWRFSFENFLADMGPSPGARYSIDRSDNNGHYTPTNCQWATKRAQALNRSTARLIKYAGRTRHLSEWAAEFGLKTNRLHARLAAGWTISVALTTPLRVRG